MRATSSAQMESVLPAVLDERGVRVDRERRRRESARLRRRAARDGARRSGATSKLRVGVVTGDDLLPRLDELIAAGHELANMETGEPLVDRARSRALRECVHRRRRRSSRRSSRGANVVVTGRCTDTALTLAPLVHEFGWAPHMIGTGSPSGIVAGHIIECGAQCTGGNCAYDWRTIPDLANVGFPIVEVAERRHRSSSRSIRAPAAASTCTA